MLSKLFNPSTVALIGASRDEKSVGHTIARNLLKSDCKIFFVNPNTKEILNKKCYDAVLDIKGAIELAIIATPAKTVPTILDQCGKKNIKNIIIISSGFSETGNNALENQLIKTVQKYNLNLLGPNCLGFINKRINATFFDEMPGKGKTVLISQSGAIGAGLMDWLVKEGIGIHTFVSPGNMVGVALQELIHYFSQDKTVKTIALYIENLKNARTFLKECARSSKTIIALKAGISKQGINVAKTHTGAMATDDNITTGAFKQYGIIRVETIEELIHFFLAAEWQPIPCGKSIMIITNAGGLGVVSADSMSEQGLTLARIPLKQLNKILPEQWNKTNPIDILGDATAERYKKVLELLLKYRRDYAGALIILTPQAMSEPLKTAKEIAAFSKKLKKPCYTSFLGGNEIKDAVRFLYKHKIPVFEEPAEAIKCFKKLNK